MPARALLLEAALARGEWPAYAGTYASAKYSPLDQINRSNVASLKVAWRWASPDADVRQANQSLDPSIFNEATPIMVGGVLYTSTSLSQVAAIDALTGRTKWVFDPGVYQYGTPANLGWVHRGVAYWRGGDDERVIMLLAEVRVPANASGAPMTFMAGGKQHIAFPSGGGGLPEELIALTLP